MHWQDAAEEGWKRDPAPASGLAGACSHQLTATSKIISHWGGGMAVAHCSLAEILDKVPRT